MDFPNVRTPFSISSKVAQNRYQGLVLAEIALVVAIASVAATVVVDLRTRACPWRSRL